MHISGSMQLDLPDTFDPIPLGGAASFQDFPTRVEPFTHGSGFQSQLDHDQLTRGYGGSHRRPQETLSKKADQDPSTGSKDDPPPKVKRTRRRKQKAPLDEETQQRKRQEALDKNKRAAAKCRAKKKVEEEKQNEKLRRMKRDNEELHVTLFGLMEDFEKVKDWVEKHGSCADADANAKADMTVARRHIGELETMKNRYHEDSAKYMKLKSMRPDAWHEEGEQANGEFDTTRPLGSEFSNFDTEFGDGINHVATQESFDHQTSPLTSTMSGGDGIDRINSLGLEAPMESQFLVPNADSVTSKQSPNFVAPSISTQSIMTDSDIEAQLQGTSSYPDILSPAFNTGYTGYMPSYSNDFNLFQSPPFKSINPPFNPTEELSLIDTDILSQLDSTYGGSPTSKSLISPPSKMSNAFSAATPPHPKSPPITRRDSGFGAESSNGSHLRRGGGQGLLDHNMMLAQAHPMTILERRMLRGEAAQEQKQQTTFI